MKKYRCNPSGCESISIDLSPNNFDLLEKNTRKNKTRYLLIGFDTEYQSSFVDKSFDHELLSYQYSCECVESDPDALSYRWSGIVLPDGPSTDERLSLHEFIGVALSNGVKRFPEIIIPRDIYVVAHFTRADVPGFKDFKDSDQRYLLNLDNIRGSFSNIKKDIKFSLSGGIEVSIKIRDTLHLSPQGAKSLQKLGDILDFKKISLAPTESESLQIKKNMKKLMEENWDLFREYAIRDAEVCARYAVDIMKQYYVLTGSFKLPVTLSSIGVDLLLQHWKDHNVDPLRIVGKESIKEKKFSKSKGRYQSFPRKVFLKKLHWHLDFVTECYHGGRNEQFWFGPAIEGIWYDYDLQSAYPSAMSLIGIPDWDKIKVIYDIDELLSFRPVDLAYACVDFEFDESVRYPCLPVRTDHGIIFPRKGNCSTHISEIKLAESLGCSLKLVEGRYVPSVRDGKGNRVFEDFLTDCISKRNQYQKKTVMNLFWKEVANSTYGKVAQGLRPRRIYNLKADDMETLEESKITNPFYASFITAFCRGTLSEIMTNLPKKSTIFSVTTDGFLSTASVKDIVNATRGILCRYYKDARTALVKDETVYEVKHVIRQPIGWRTRGQATLKEGTEDDHPSDSPKSDELVVLAKGGIKLPDKLEKSEENRRIVEYFFDRTPDTKILMILGLGIKDMYRGGKDFGDKDVTKRLSMEFDWKRKPVSAGMFDVVFNGHDYSHLYFTTEPWDSTEQFFLIRNMWSEYQKSSYKCLKTDGDYRLFSDYVKSKLSLDEISQKYLKKKDGDINRLKRDLIVAWRYRKAGTHVLKPHAYGYEQIFPTYKMRAAIFAEILSRAGIPCKKSDVDNGIKIKSFVPNQVPDTKKVRLKLDVLKEHLFPKLDIFQFLSNKPEWDIDVQ